MEIRFHGRGGQGTVLASVILAKAFFQFGYEVQSFPLFGVERRGAPVEAYLRLSEKKIRICSNVYKPDHILVQDNKLLNHVDITKGLKPGGWILLNLPRLPSDLEPFKGFKLAFVPASQIALKYGLGSKTHPIINTAMVGAFAGILDMPSLESVEEAILSEVPVKQPQNVDASREAFESVEMFGLVD